MNIIDFCHASVCTFVSAHRCEGWGGGFIIHNKKTCVHSNPKCHPPGVRGLASDGDLTIYTNAFLFFCPETFHYSVMASLDTTR